MRGYGAVKNHYMRANEHCIRITLQIQFGAHMIWFKTLAVIENEMTAL